MIQYILHVFNRAYIRFTSLPEQVVPINMMKYFYLDVNFLSNGKNVPDDKCCKCCGKIGHFAKDCPQSKRNKKNDQRSRGNNRAMNKKSR